MERGKILSCGHLAAHQPLLRSSVSAAHTDKQIDLAVEMITKVGLDMGVIQPERLVSVG